MNVFKVILNYLDIHYWVYDYSTKHDCYYRECKWTGKQQVSGYSDFIDIDYKIK